MRPPIAASPTLCSTTWPLADFGNRAAAFVRGGPLGRAVWGGGARCRAHPGLRRVLLRDDAGDQGVRARAVRVENVHTLQGATDWAVSLDQLQATLPNATSASLVVSWFGTDLRAGDCRVKPGVELAEKTTSPLTWSVAGLVREDAHLVSTRTGGRLRGGDALRSDGDAAIEDLKARGLEVLLTPFILMDVPEGNSAARSL